MRISTLHLVIKNHLSCYLRKLDTRLLKNNIDFENACYIVQYVSRHAFLNTDAWNPIE